MKKMDFVVLYLTLERVAGHATSCREIPEFAGEAGEYSPYSNDKVVARL